MYMAVLPLHDIAFAPQERVAVAAANSMFGNMGTYVIAVMIMISTFGCNNGLILAGARVYYSMAKDELFFKNAGNLNKHSVPAWALWAQCVVASLLCLSGKYGDLAEYDLICCGDILCAYHLRYFYFEKKNAGCRKALQSFWLPCIACHLYFDGTCILYFAHYL